MGLFERKRVRDDFCCLYLTHDSVAFVQGEISSNNQSPITIKRCEFLPGCLTATQDRERIKLFKALIAKHHVKGAPCYAVLAPDYYHLLPLDLPENLPKQELTAALPWLVKELIDYAIDEAVIDSFPMVTAPGQAEKIYVVTARAEPLKQLQQQIISAGLQLLCFDITELTASYLLARLTAEHDKTALLIFHDNYHQVVVNQGERLYFTRIIQDAGDDWLANADSASFDNISLEIQRSLDYSQAQMRQALPVNVLLAPTLADETIVLQQLAQRLTSPVKPLDISPLFSFAVEADKAMRTHCLFALAAAVKMGERQ
ncbi:MAG: hypothetical protein GY782_02150 [Gammaproteobacteria bacterium]|nr:hypothetical protein [Gammaproteobacteria bacterium]